MAPPPPPTPSPRTLPLPLLLRLLSAAAPSPPSPAGTWDRARQGQAVRPWAQAQRMTGSAWAAPPPPHRPAPPSRRPSRGLSSALSRSAAARHSLTQELQGEDDHEDVRSAQLGVSRQLQLAHTLQGADRPRPQPLERAGQVKGWGLARVGTQLDSGLSGIRAQLRLRLRLWSRLNLGLRLRLGQGSVCDQG